MEILSIVLDCIFILILLRFVFVVLTELYKLPYRIWWNTYRSGIRISIFTVLGIYLRVQEQGVKHVLFYFVKLKNAGVEVEGSSLAMLEMLEMLETHYICTNNLETITNLLISSQNTSLDLSFMEICAYDLAERTHLIKVVLLAIEKQTDKIDYKGVSYMITKEKGDINWEQPIKIQSPTWEQPIKIQSPITEENQIVIYQPETKFLDKDK